MTVNAILSGLQTVLAPILLSDLKLKLVIAENPGTALVALAASPNGGVVVINPGDDESPDSSRGTRCNLELQVTVSALRGLSAHKGDDLHKDRANRASYFSLFHDVISHFRRVQFRDPSGNTHPEIDCRVELRYQGSFWLVTDDADAPCRDRTAKFLVSFALDPAGDELPVALPVAG